VTHHAKTKEIKVINKNKNKIITIIKERILRHHTLSMHFVSIKV
jgi:hypothetical protein